VVGFVLVAVFAQIFRNWLLLHAVGVDASFFDAIAVLIAVVTLAQLPVGPSVGAAAAVLILGSDGVAAAAAAGVLLTATGTVGGLCFAGWAGADRLWTGGRWGAERPRAPTSRLSWFSDRLIRSQGAWTPALRSWPPRPHRPGRQQASPSPGWRGSETQEVKWQRALMPRARAGVVLDHARGASEP
jgi:hypothetical protein